MKKRIISVVFGVIVCCAPLALIGPGCVNPATGTVDQQTIDTTATILRGAARDGAIVAMQDNPDTKIYFELAADTLSEFLTGKDMTPGAFQAALLNVKAAQLTNQWVQIGIGTVIDLYQLYYGQYVKNTVNGDAVAKAFVTAVQDGLNMALGKPVSVKRNFRISKPGSGAATGALLPRPVNRK